MVVPLDTEDTASLHVVEPAKPKSRCNQPAMVRHLSGCATEAETSACLQMGRYGNTADWKAVRRGLATCAMNCQGEVSVQPVKLFRRDTSNFPTDPVVEELIDGAVDELADYVGTKEDHVN